MNKRVTTSTMTITLSTGELEMYWVVVPDGMTSEVAWTTQERHGPFRTDAEVRAEHSAHISRPRREGNLRRHVGPKVGRDSINATN
jgi:hypothetical protein